MWNSKFPGYVPVKETEHFAVIYNPEKDPFDVSRSAYYLVYKPLMTIETDCDSYAVSMMYLAQGEDTLAQVADGNKAPAQQELVLN